MDEPVRTPVAPGLIQRVAQGLSYIATGRKPNSDWFGPGTAMAPVAPPGTQPRAFDYSPVYNYNMRPRANSPVTFEQLRALADNYDLLRLMIETRKDQVANMDWSINLKEVQPGQASKDARCLDLEQFLAYPDKENPWNTWVRMLLEDMFVIDAASIYLHKNLDGSLYALQLIDGATIDRKMDVTGRTPILGPAYQQIVHGLPAIDLSRDELIYSPRNKRIHTFYGYSPVEQIIMTVNIALRRQMHQLEYYTEGNIPEAFVGVPTEWTPDQITDFQKYFDAIHVNNTAMRRRAKFVPTGTSGGLQIQQTREAMLKDMYDEWLARIIAFAFSCSPMPLVREQNRSTSETSQEQALDEGLQPVLSWVRDIINMVIAKCFGWTDIEFKWGGKSTPDPQIAWEINEGCIRLGVKSIDKVRQEMGLDPIGMKEVIFGLGPLGLVFVEDLIDPTKRAQLMAQMNPAAAQAAAPVQPPDPKTLATTPSVTPQVASLLSCLKGQP